VGPIKENTLLTEPWQSTCALLVFPGGADLGYQRVLGSDAAGPSPAAAAASAGASGNWLVGQYVGRGGRYLGLCAGGYYGSARCEFEVGRGGGMEVVGARELALFPGTCRGGAFAGFEYGSEVGAVAARLAVRRRPFDGLRLAGLAAEAAQPADFRCYVNGGGVFVDAEQMAEQGVEVLANYMDETAVKGGRAAVVYCRKGKGAALLMGTHPE
jgi:biotin--protein ligase